jgi:hypothetical protein
MSSGIMQAQEIGQARAVEHALAAEQAQATGQGHATEPEQLPPMTAETARRLAAALAPHLLAMRVVTAGTPYGACAGTGPGASGPASTDLAATDAAATGPAVTNTPAAAQLPPASAATTIFIAGMLERICA